EQFDKITYHRTNNTAAYCVGYTYFKTTSGTNLNFYFKDLKSVAVNASSELKSKYICLVLQQFQTAALQVCIGTLVLPFASLQSLSPGHSGWAFKKLSASNIFPPKPSFEQRDRIH
ncbi:hypothetical protein C0J52_22138, partial [Blattella germanica]